MKKLISFFTALSLVFALSVSLSAYAASGTASITGPGTVRAGDTITLTLNLNGSGGILGCTGEVQYNTSQLTLQSVKQKIAAPWAVEFNNSAGVIRFVSYDNNQTSPIKGSKAMFTMTFKVSDVQTGTNIVVTSNDVVVSDGKADINVGDAKYSVQTSAPLSGNTALSSLLVTNAQISPSFDTNTTSYTASVPFSVSKLDIKATAQDSKAKVSISNPNLAANGKTNVTVTVQAESGAKKTYKIVVSREKDPNYVPSKNNNLAGISLDNGILSPVFHPETTNYVVWLPYEIDKIAVTGKVADNTASVATSGGDNLAAGQDNKVMVTCTAENGEKKIYTIVVKRAAAHDGTVDDKPDDETSSITSTTTPTENKPQTKSSYDTPIWLTILLCLIFCGVGFGGGFIAFKKR